MVTAILAVISALLILAGICIYKNKLYKGAILFFYTEALRKQPDAADEDIKDRTAEIVGMFYMISGCILGGGLIVSIISGLLNYILLFVLLAVLLFYIITYVRVNITINKK